MNIIFPASFSLSFLLLISCENRNELQTLRYVTESTYGKMPDGREVSLYTLTNENGITAKIIEYGAILVGVEVPDHNGNIADVTHGYDSLEGWLTNTSYFGSTVGRYGNRIAEGRFSLDGKTYQLATNNDPGGLPCALHGGIRGFDKVLWSGEMTADGRGVELTYISKDGEEGYPGELTTIVSYSLNKENELIWKARATVTGSSTPVNIVHHSYWNLSNNQMSSINDHLLTLNAEHFLPTNAGLIPTGERRAVEGTPFDFTEATAIGERVEAQNESLQLGGGYDHCWVLTEKDGLIHAATLHDPKSGRTMELHTDQPGIQFYGGNFLDGSATGKNGNRYPYRSACCLETQLFPDSPNQPSFPSCILAPGEVYLHTMVHKFTW